ncbi:hypothetical protein LVD15_24850 [Fulvivirga maritima]|uniref:acyl-CoA dehydrogenase family protein n=1 Tax=Fulvivirga maritima TaxID=2904247 RepID=UPI001F1FBB26|nr:acyl-CoA dehydrogenase family protein [Fulvivirga maritima]UII26487.1 hypothetical protein LVD15_24850 [Fulvivirga maritima]
MIHFNRPTIDLIRNTFLQQHFQDHFPTEILDLIYEHKLFKIFIPEQLGGLECSFPEGLKIMEMSAYIDGDFGWAVQIGSGGGYFTGYLSKEVADQYIAQSDFVIAGSGMATGNAVTNGSGYEVSGQWKYCSGSHYATLFTANCTLNNSQKVSAFAFDPNQVAIINDWKAYGMENTLSHTIKVKKAQVPEHMLFNFERVINNYDYLIYYFPFNEFARGCITSVLIGLFKHLLNEANVYYQTKNYSSEKESSLQHTIKTAEKENEKLSELFYEEAQNCWSQLENGLMEDSLKEFNQAIDNYIRFINQSSHSLFQHLGMYATYRDNAFNKAWRDLTTAAQHILAKWY